MTHLFDAFSLQEFLQQLQYQPNDPLLFNSSFFFYFFSLFFVVYLFAVNLKSYRIGVVIAFSLYFFYKACGWYVGFILLAAVVDFNISNMIYAARRPLKKTLLLVFSLALNLGLLVAFKYTDFFIGIANQTVGTNWSMFHLVLPVGISFYTFENISYTIDVYRGHFRPVKRFIDYLFFLSFFPKLMMGPIVRAADFIPQIRRDISITQHDVAFGLFYILSGCFKKVVLSDYLSLNIVDVVFDDPSRHNGLSCLTAVYAYAVVIYCDFSGYSDMAIGIARWMGLRIDVNFLAPYQSASITEFWRRWHISLSSWLRDYLYIPLGGNRKGKFRTYVNLFITMLLGGLWHGANWTFLLWGVLHGAALALDKLRLQLMGDDGKTFFNKPVWRVVGALVTFHFVCFTWIFFGPDSLAKSSAVLYQIVFNFNVASLPVFVSHYGVVLQVIVIALALHMMPLKWNEKIIERLVHTPVIWKSAVMIAVLLAIAYLKMEEAVMPVYLQF